MKSGNGRLCLAAVLILLLWGCATAPDLTQAPALSLGEEICARCGMLIGDARFAAAYWTTEGEARRFDDIGEMVLYYHDSGESVVSFWVHDYLSGDWLPAESAFFVHDPELHTPMGFGVAACRDAEQARALAFGQKGAHQLDWPALLELAATGALAQHHH